jgi:hypothetical protein
MPIGAKFLAMAIEAGLTNAITPARRSGGLERSCLLQETQK